MNNLSLGFDERLSPALFSSKKTKYETPQWLFYKLNKEFHFTIDVCAPTPRMRSARTTSPRTMTVLLGHGADKCVG